MKKIPAFLILFILPFCMTHSANAMRNITPLVLTAEMSQGWNLGNTLDAFPRGETSWGNPITTEAMIEAIAQKGFKTLRIPTTWYPHLGPAPEYRIDTAWLNRVETVMSYAFKNKMYVILNIHHDDFNKKHPGTWLKPTKADQVSVEQQLTRMWTQIAMHFKAYGDCLIFETMNEPRLIDTPEEWTGGTAESRMVINKLNLAALRAIRKTGGNNAKRFIMCPSYAANSAAVALNDFVIPDNDPRVIVSIHNYGPYSFCMQVPGTNSWGSASDKLAIDKDMDYYYKQFISKGIAVVIGEWGSVNKNNTEARALHAAYFVQAAAKRKIACVWWDNGQTSHQGYAMFNRKTLTWFFPIVADSIQKKITPPAL